MSQRDLYEQITSATGESLSVIENLGFVELRRIAFEREPSSLADDLDAELDALILTADRK